MIDTDTFLTTLYVIVDEFCKSELPGEPVRPGQPCSLSRSEVITLATLGQWSCFRNQRDFYRRVQGHLRPYFRRLPHRSQFNRLTHKYASALVAFGVYLAKQLKVEHAPYEILDTSGVPVRNVKRRGQGWLAGLANIGKCSRLGWYNGFRLLLATTPQGVITGFAFGAGSAKDQPLTEAMLAVRSQPRPAVASVGRPATGPYIADKGFAGDTTHMRWQQLYQATVVTEPQTNSKRTWPADWQRWLRSIRQVVETVSGRLMDFFRLDHDRPHTLLGFQTNLAAKVTLHNFCIWLNRQLDRADLAFADLIDW